MELPARSDFDTECRFTYTKQKSTYITEYDLRLQLSSSTGLCPAVDINRLFMITMMMMTMMISRTLIQPEKVAPQQAHATNTSLGAIPKLMRALSGNSCKFT